MATADLSFRGSVAGVCWGVMEGCWVVLGCRGVLQIGSASLFGWFGGYMPAGLL